MSWINLGEVFHVIRRLEGEAHGHYVLGRVAAPTRDGRRRLRASIGLSGVPPGVT